MPRPALPPATQPLWSATRPAKHLLNPQPPKNRDPPLQILDLIRHRASGGAAKVPPKVPPLDVSSEDCSLGSQYLTMKTSNGIQSHTFARRGRSQVFHNMLNIHEYMTLLCSFDLLSFLFERFASVCLFYFVVKNREMIAISCNVAINIPNTDTHHLSTSSAQPYGSYKFVQYLEWHKSDTTTTDMVFGRRTASAPSAAAARPAQPVPQPISTTCKDNFDKQNIAKLVDNCGRSIEINWDQLRSMKMEWTQWISMEKLCRRVWSRLIFIARLAAQQPGLFNKASRQQQRAVIENPSDAQRSILMQRLHSQPAALGSFHRLDNAIYLLWHSML